MEEEPSSPHLWPFLSPYYLSISFKGFQKHGMFQKHGSHKDAKYQSSGILYLDRHVSASRGSKSTDSWRFCLLEDLVLLFRFYSTGEE